jgi:hypothetical protein
LVQLGASITITGQQPQYSASKWVFHQSLVNHVMHISKIFNHPFDFESCSFSKYKGNGYLRKIYKNEKNNGAMSYLMRGDLLGVARSSRIHEICGGEQG